MRIMGELFSVIDTASGQDGELTLVVGKGMNSEKDFALIDANPRIHSITTYSTFHAEELIHVDRDRFEPVDTDNPKTAAIWAAPYRGR